MMATEHSALTNSLWRELLDYLPVPALLFRIEDNDQARLIFANREIEQVLGFTPGEYVLESESEGRIQHELNDLVEQIARQSHAGANADAGVRQGDHREPQYCELTGKPGNRTRHEFRFRIFMSKTAKNHFIVVTLGLSGRKGAGSSSPGMHATDEDHFIAGSEVMQGVMQKAGIIVRQPVHGWLTGEKGTGRTSLARIISRMIEARTGVISAINWEGGQKPDPSGWHIDTGVRTAVIILDDAEKLESGHFNAIKTRIDLWISAGVAVKVLVTSTGTPEQLYDQGKLPDAWIYGMSFNTVLMPQLRLRGDDVIRIARNYIANASVLLGIREPLLDMAGESQIRRYDWPGHIEELQTVLGRELVTGSRRLIRLNFDDAGGKPDRKPYLRSVQPDGKSPFIVLPYEEMSANYLRQVLEFTEGKIYGEDGAAALLKMKPTTLQSRLKKLGVR